jgi:hypothetical protein
MTIFSNFRVPADFSFSEIFDDFTKSQVPCTRLRGNTFNRVYVENGSVNNLDSEYKFVSASENVICIEIQQLDGEFSVFPEEKK